MKYLIWFLSFAFCVSCESQQSEVTYLPDEKLVRIMADLNVAEAATNGLAGYPKDSLMKVYFTQVFEMHGTTVEVYEKDLRILSADLPKLQQIVLKSIKLLEGTDTKPKL